MKAGLLGKVLGHSKSPEIHERMMNLLRVDEPFHYDLIEIPEEAIPATLQKCKDEGYMGLNVTIPYKQKVMPFLTDISWSARMIGAVNTIHFTPKGMFGYNTDYDGFGRSLIHAGIPVKNQAYTVLGTGGAAHSILQYLADHKAKSLTVVSRHPDQQDGARPFLEQVGATLISYDALGNHPGDVLVNCTPVGMFPDTHCPVTEEVIKTYGAVVDLIYNPKDTPLLQLAKAHGMATLNGMYMLVAQAVGSEEYWLHRSFSSELIEDIAKEME